MKGRDKQRAHAIDDSIMRTHAQVIGIFVAIGRVEPRGEICARKTQRRRTGDGTNSQSATTNTTTTTNAHGNTIFELGSYPTESEMAATLDERQGQTASPRDHRHHHANSYSSHRRFRCHWQSRAERRDLRTQNAASEDRRRDKLAISDHKHNHNHKRTRKYNS
jgi:hypothetical protein